MAALRSFQEMLYYNDNRFPCPKSNDEMWDVAWRVWLRIALEIKPEISSELYLPSQPYLSALIHIFPSLFQHIKDRYLFSFSIRLHLYLFKVDDYV